MRCPDELTLDLWSAGALPAQEADAFAIHIAVCASCTARLAQQQAATNELGAALQLDHDELAYLDSLQLRTAWRSPAHTAAPQHLGRLALFAVVTAFLAWTLAAQPLGDAFAAATRVGLDTVLIGSAIGVVLNLGQALLAIATNPLMNFSQLLLALLALALLLWTRLQAAPHSPQGALFT